MGKFKDIVTNEMTTNNVDFETALIKAERAIRAQFTPEKNAAAWDKSCVDKFNEMNASPRCCIFLSSELSANSAFSFNQRSL